MSENRDAVENRDADRRWRIIRACDLAVPEVRIEDWFDSSGNLKPLVQDIYPVIVSHLIDMVSIYEGSEDVPELFWDAVNALNEDLTFMAEFVDQEYLLPE